MANTVVDGIQDLGNLKIGSDVYVSLLPSGSSAVMVKYAPDVQISCVVPPRDFNVNYSVSRRSSKKTLTTTTPTLIMSCGYGEVPTPTTHKNVVNGYSLWVLDTERNKGIYVKPYLFANVWERGIICFGSLQPSSLRQAFNYYWMSGFNAELMRGPHSCENKNHTYSGHIGCYCDGSKKKHECSCPKNTFHNHIGCGCTTVTKSKKCKGSCNVAACECCRAIKLVQGTALKGDEKLTQFKLKKLSECLDVIYPHCGCGWRHKRGCICLKGDCECFCLCDCCKVTCDHPICKCNCCLGNCTCICNCNQRERFEYHVKNYHEEILPEQPWKERTALFCGTSYWASPQGADGVLVTNNKHLLKMIPRQFWRKSGTDRPVVVTIANKVNDYWVFKSGGFMFRLNQNNVITK